MYLRAFCLLVLCVLCGGVATAQPAADPYAKPGHHFEVGKDRLNLVCLGSGRPVVVLDAGLGDWSPSWIPIQRRLASLTTTCAYDRAGYGFSQASRLPRTSMEIARELHALLIAAKLPRPYVLVGHSFGGLNQQAFAEMYLPDVAGIVLIDSTVSDLPLPAFLATATDAELASGRTCASLARENAFRADSRSFEDCFEWLFGLTSLPNNGVTPALLAAVKDQAKHPGPYTAHVEELANVSESQRQVRAHMRSFGSLPMIVLTATTHGENQMPAALRTKMFRFEIAWRLAQDRLASHSTCVRHDLVQSDHYIQFYRPQAVIDAITLIVSQARSTRSRC
jgi:pimeloyl-ACP methyl ester carboxylesterase